jgi:hypothetical protein
MAGASPECSAPLILSQSGEFELARLGLVSERVA